MQFDLDRDVESAARDVQAAINAAGGELPADMPTRPSYRKVNPADAPIMILSLTSKTVPIGLVADAATTILAQRIAQLKGVGQVTVGGSQQPAVRIQVDPQGLAGAFLTIEDVRTAVAASTVDAAKGNLSGPTTSRSIAANDQLFGAAQFKDVVVSSKDGAVVRLGDVATVFDSVENERIAAWTNGTRSILMIIRRQPGANIVATNELIKAALPELATSISPAIDVEVAIDRTQSVRASVIDVEHTLLISLALVVVVVFVFLRSARATAIPSVAVPVSLVGTFGVMYLLDYSLDNLSLMALTIATGFVVDDAIVVTENVSRLVEQGKPPQEAALEGAKQIGFTIVSITVSLLAVFIPILLMGGVVGRLFREFAVTLSIAISVSAVVSLTLTPMMCALLLRKDEGPHGRFYRGTEWVFDSVLRLYGRALGWVLRKRTVVGVLTLATIGATVALYVVVPKGLFPQQDVGMLMGFSEAPQDVSLPAMRDRQERIIEVVGADPDVLHVGAGGGNTSNAGTMFVELKTGKRAKADAIIARLRPTLAQFEGITLFLQATQDVRVGGRASRTQYQYTLQDADIEELRAWGPKVLERLRTVRELSDVNTDQQSGGLGLAVELDRDSASRLGITAQQLDATLYDAFGQRQIATTYAAMNQYRVVLEMKPALVLGPEAIDHPYLRAGDGGLVPVRTLTKRSPGATPLSIAHQGQFPATTISFNLAPGISLGEAVVAVHRAEADIGMPASINPQFQGHRAGVQGLAR